MVTMVAMRKLVGLFLLCCAPLGCGNETSDPVVGTIQSAMASPGKVLILSTTVTGGTSSLEASLAGSGTVSAGPLGTLTGLGFTVDVVSPATWASMTTAQFASYQAIILGDPTCSTSPSSAAAAIANTDVWGPAVTGNVVVIGTDPVFHFTFGPGAEIAQVTFNAIKFATSKPGSTGMYISLSCYYVDAAPMTPVPLLSPFGSFTVHEVGCFNDAHIVAEHPALAGLTDTILSNWSCSVHEAFDGFPTSTFVPLAIARNAIGGGSLTFADGSTGLPYILARGAVPVKCGDSLVQSPEECDDGASNGTCGDACSSICKLHWCGDGTVDEGEQCDLGCGNGAPGSGCTADCRAVETNHPPIVKCTDVTVAAGAACSADASIDAGSSDPDPGDTITCTQVPTGPYGLGTTGVTLTCTDSHGASSSCTGTVTVADLAPPTISCPANQSIECGGGGGAATFTATSTDNCSLASQACVPPSGSVFPLGTTPDTCTATDGSGNSSSCTFDVTVRDTTAPTIVTSGPKVLWPPDHKYQTFNLSDCVTSVTDACDGILDINTAGKITRVTSDEAEDDKLTNGASGDGNTCNDIVITGNTSVDLRAERSGKGNGRVYTVFFDVTDASGNVSSSSCKVAVPHDQSGAPAVEDGCSFCEGAGCGSCPGHDDACQ